MRRPLLFAALVPVLATCSTLAPIPSPEECRQDADCTEDGDVCAPETFICVPGNLSPPLAHLAFDIQEFDGSTLVWRTEVSGCDELVDASPQGLSIRRNDLQQTFELSAFVVEPSTPPLVSDLLPPGSELEVSQSARFGTLKPTRRRVQYPTFADDMMMELAPTIVRVPRYHPLDDLPAMLGPEGFVLWQVIPSTVPVDRAPMFQMIEPPVTQDACTTNEECCPDGDCDSNPNICLQSAGECTKIGNPRFAYGVVYDELASRAIAGDVTLVAADGGTTPGVDVTVQLRHADDPEGTQRLGVFALSDTPLSDRPPRCDGGGIGAGDQGDGCIAGEQFCDDETSQCQLALAGRAANEASSTDENGQFEISVYDYARPGDRGVMFLRWFRATVSATNGAVPTTSYEFVVSMPPADNLPQWDEKLCAPDWGTPLTAEFRLTGAPVTFVGKGAQAFECCDIGCLPATADAAAALPMPPKAAGCSGTTAAGATPSAVASAPAELAVEDEPAWEALGCILPMRDEDGNIGALEREASCVAGEDASVCTLPDLAGGPDGSPREYTLRIESPVGSVLRSIAMPITIDDATAMQELELPQRAILHGRVRLADALCDPDTIAQTQCGSERALVVAERLRMPGEQASTAVGPFFHEVETFYDPIAGRPGAYVLPLDPGVYLVTAIPASGSPGGPADIVPVRIGADETEHELDMTLREGVLVSLALRGDRSAFVTPLDVGSWRGQLTYPGTDDPIDLNEIGACLSAPEEGPIACKIRRLIPSATLTTSQVGNVRFTARAATEAAASCPGD
ncbi:MAG TPA: hypothetical protein VFG69_09495 [Nannocystaceae bacterium]|nr:hypothetical protein [Nannocystaceae bacterium]